MPDIIIPTPTAHYDETYTAPVRELLFKTAQYLSNDELQLLEKACAYAFCAHDGTTRKSGEPYITHPIAVTTELAKWHMDVEVLCAGLMHDVLEDTPITKAQMEAEFGHVITEMVDGVSKLEKLTFNDKNEHQAASFRKLIMAMTKDVRIIIIKLSDRLHNMRTLGGVPVIAKRRSTAQETLEIYAPIANRLGMNVVYRELQDLALLNIHPQRYRVLRQAMDEAFYRYTDFIHHTQKRLTEALIKFNLHNAQVDVIPKNLYSVYKKMENNNIKFNKVKHAYSFQILVNTLPECYLALGAAHSLFQPRLGKIKDIIAIPKSNNYQSLHTILAGNNGMDIEIQIRTHQMNAVAQYGITSTQINDSNAGFMRTKEWLKNVSDLQEKSMNAIDFLENVKNDLFPNEVYIFTPKGKIHTLPRGATPIDFAYSIHTDVGNQCVAARINGELMPLRTKLRSGNTVEIITSPEGRPNPTWLNFTVSSRARTAIRNYVKNTSREEAIKLGGMLLAKALDSLLPSHIASSEDILQRYLTQLETQNLNLEDIQFQIGVGATLPITIVHDIANLAGEHFGDQVKLSTVLVNTHDSVRTHLGKCCHPVLGDAIRGVIVAGKGLMIHRDTCPTLLKSTPEQQLDAEWGAVSHSLGQYDTELVVLSEDAHALLAAMTSSISECGGNIVSLDTLSNTKEDGAEGFVKFKFTLNVVNLEQLNQIIERLQRIPQVRNVTRI